MESEILKELQARAVDGEIACADAHDIARLFDVSPIDVGKMVNRASDLRFNRCQLGLFGYGLKAEGKSKIVLRAENMPADIVTALQAEAPNDRISCAAVWEIADRFKYPRLGIANIIETLGLKVKPCQLGCF